MASGEVSRMARDVLANLHRHHDSEWVTAHTIGSQIWAGWSTGIATARARANLDDLFKAGFVQNDTAGRPILWRITDAGRAALLSHDQETSHGR